MGGGGLGVAAPTSVALQGEGRQWMDRTDIHERDLMRMRRMAGLLFAGGLAAGLGAGLTATAHASDPTPARESLERDLPAIR